VDDTPVDSFDDLLKRFNLAKHHSAITLASKSVRNKSILLLHKATTLVLNDQVMLNLVTIWNHARNIFSNEPRRYASIPTTTSHITMNILKVVSCLPDVEAVDVQHLLAGGWYIYEIMQKTDTVNRVQNGKKAKEITKQDQQDEFLESINTMKAFTNHAETWFQKLSNWVALHKIPRSRKRLPLWRRSFHLTEIGKNQVSASGEPLLPMRVD
jgi:hypothetical protein